MKGARGMEYGGLRDRGLEYRGLRGGNEAWSMEE